MNKHFHNSLRALFLSLAVLLSLPMLAANVLVNGIRYNINESSNTAIVIARLVGKYSGEVSIPDSVEYKGAFYCVTSIGEETFYQCSGLTSVTIGNSVTSIGDYAFSGCSGLTSVTIPNSVTSIGDGAFYHCSGLTSVTIPNSVTRIGSDAFSYCSGLTSVTIGNGVTSIGQGAFSSCSGLISVHISDIAAWCNIDFGDSASNPLLYAEHLYLNGEEVKDLVIPNSMTSIGNYAFDSCKGLTSVTIPNSVTSIGESAFSFCTGLTSVTIGNSVTSIGDCAFWVCSGLTSVTIPNSVESIGYNAFAGCSGLTSIVVEEGNIVYDSRNKCNAIIETATNTLHNGCKTTIIPNGVTSIGRNAFKGCSDLTSITIPNSVTSIGTGAFGGCSGLTSVTIPNSVTSIGMAAFQSCDGLTSVTIPNSVTSIGAGGFNSCSGLTSVTIGNSVTSIGEYAFSSCSGLTSVTIGNSVTSIEDWAFRNCPELLDVYCYAEKVPSTYSEAFDGSYPENATLHVPDASIDSYKATAPWYYFGKIVALTPEETGIVETEIGNVKSESSAVYDLSGRRGQKGQKGVFIQNGKVMVR